MTEIPELLFLLSLVIYLLVSEKIEYFRLGEGANKLIGVAKELISSRLPFVIVASVLLLAVVLNGQPQIGFALSSALAYLVLNEIGKAQQKKHKVHCKAAPVPDAPQRKRNAASPGSQHQPQQWRRDASVLRGGSDVMSRAQAAPKTMDAVVAFQMRELVEDALPTASDEKVTRELINIVRRSVRTVIPEAEVVGRPKCNLSRIGAKGLKPEIDIVVNCSADVLFERLKAYYLNVDESKRNQKSMATLLPDVLQKTATRVLSSRLCPMRFWRSQFTGPEPKIVLLAPVSLGIFEHPLRVNFAVNNPYPIRFGSILRKSDTRTRELVVLVSHWAQARGIANSSKGHLHEYAWSLLVVYFIRFKTEADKGGEVSAVDILKEFFRFYGAWLDKDAAIYIQFTKGQDSSVEKQTSPESTLWGIPHIEDPFSVPCTVAASMTGDGVARLKEEFGRAVAMFAPGTKSTLTELFDPWIPPHKADDEPES
jgi:hypothetical protein